MCDDTILLYSARLGDIYIYDVYMHQDIIAPRPAYSLETFFTAQSM